MYYESCLSKHSYFLILILFLLNCRVKANLIPTLTFSYELQYFECHFYCSLCTHLNFLFPNLVSILVSKLSDILIDSLISFEWYHWYFFLTFKLDFDHYFLNQFKTLNLLPSISTFLILFQLRQYLFLLFFFYLPLLSNFTLSAHQTFFVIKFLPYYTINLLSRIYQSLYPSAVSLSYIFSPHFPYPKCKLLQVLSSTFLLISSFLAIILIFASPFA